MRADKQPRMKAYNSLIRVNVFGVDHDWC